MTATSSMAWLLPVILLLAAISYWAGFRAAPHPGQYRSQAGFFILIALAVFTGYFVYREFSAIQSLAQIIVPVPEIDEITYIPTQTEIAAVSSLVDAATPPLKNNSFSLPHSPDQDEQPDYWLVTSSLSASAAVDFYRNNAHKTGWVLQKETPPWIKFTRGNERLTLYITEAGRGTGSRILYSIVLDH